MARVLIFGATSAIASEVALLHARRGDRLHLVGRSVRKLEAISLRCKALTRSAVTTTVADLVDLDAIEPLVRACIEVLGGVDTALVAHGELVDELEAERSFQVAERSLRVNFLSAVAIVLPLANHLEQERAGRLGVITSVAGDRGRPRNYTYGSAKGGLGLYLQGVRSRLHPAGVSVTTLKLGPVDTPMTATHTKSRIFSRPEPVAAGIVRAMDGRRREVYVPGYWSLIMAVVRNLPEWIFQKIPSLSGR